MALQTTNCDRVRLQALDGVAYGTIISPIEVNSDLYATTTQWLVVGGVRSGEILTTDQVNENYDGYFEVCTQNLRMQDLQGNDTTDYPVAVFTPSGSFLGIAEDADQFAELWNEGNAELGQIFPRPGEPFNFDFAPAVSGDAPALLGAQWEEFPLLTFADLPVPSLPYGLFQDDDVTFKGIATTTAQAAALWNATAEYGAIARAITIDDQAENVLCLVRKNEDPYPNVRAMRYVAIGVVAGTPNMLLSPGHTVRKGDATIVRSEDGVLGDYSDFGLNASSYGVGGSIPLVDTGSVYHRVPMAVGTNYIFHNEGEIEDAHWFWCDVFGQFKENSGALPPTVGFLAIQSFTYTDSARSLSLANFINWQTAMANVEAVSFNGGLTLEYDGEWMNAMPNLKTFQLICNGVLIELADLNISAGTLPNLEWFSYRRNNAGTPLAADVSFWNSVGPLSKGVDIYGSRMPDSAAIDAAFNALASALVGVVPEANARLTLQGQNPARTSASDAAVATLTTQGYTIG